MNRTRIALAALAVMVAGCDRRTKPPVSMPANMTETSSWLVVETTAATVTDIAHEAGMILSGPKLPPVPPELLVRATTSSDTNVIIKTLAEIDLFDTNSSNVCDALSLLLKHSEPDVRRAALNVVFASDITEQMLSALVPCLNDQDEDIRETAGDIISTIETKEAMDVLVINLTNQHELIRETCESGLKLHSAESFDTLEEWRAWWSSNRTSFAF